MLINSDKNEWNNSDEVVRFWWASRFSSRLAAKIFHSLSKLSQSRGSGKRETIRHTIKYAKIGEKNVILIQKIKKTIIYFIIFWNPQVCALPWTWTYFWNTWTTPGTWGNSTSRVSTTTTDPESTPKLPDVEVVRSRVPRQLDTDVPFPFSHPTRSQHRWEFV